ncbi:DoxX family protein [Mucilaginibacter ginkgonis]|uniref:Uncharacterized protein n=1 Tax=Mucilaginibacter ginkgonis TaxID=2682091 RepID=A0A6I4HZY4_9SPHI|nr:DoxX family protein [Mucilaginibacter ginkgonis]QQL48824.1 hypothetical protein GO620_011610 [Mucilaginibacter ginkgonis]
MSKFKAIHLFRIGLGVDMFMHGLVRIPKLEAFVAKSSKPFAETILPNAFVSGFLHVLPFLEAITGILILLGGRLSRVGYILGGLIVSALIFGTTLHEDWNLAGQQLIYIIAFAMAVWLFDHDKPTEPQN